MPTEVKQAVKEVGVEQTEYTALTDDIVRASVRCSIVSQVESTERLGRRVRAREEERNAPMRRGFERTDRESPDPLRRETTLMQIESDQARHSMCHRKFLLRAFLCALRWF